MIEKEIARKGLFTWDRTADLLWKTIEKVLENDLKSCG